jgi:hypothetical protein
MISISLITPAMEVHMTGCADIARSIKQGRTKHNDQAELENKFTGETMVEAIIAADEDMAEMFGEEAYTQSSRDNGCWQFVTCQVAPCVKITGIAFDQDGRPSAKQAKAVKAVKVAKVATSKAARVRAALAAGATLVEIAADADIDVSYAYAWDILSVEIKKNNIAAGAARKAVK